MKTKQIFSDSNWLYSNLTVSIFEACTRARQANLFFLTKKKIFWPKWMSRPRAPTPRGPISMLEVLDGVSFYRLSIHVFQVLIKLQPPPHFRGLLQKYSNYMPLLVLDGFLFKQN